MKSLQPCLQLAGITKRDRDDYRQIIGGQAVAAKPGSSAESSDGCVVCSVEVVGAQEAAHDQCLSCDEEVGRWVRLTHAPRLAIAA